MFNETIKEIKDLVQDSDKIIFVSGNFNIVHPGHLRMLRFAKESGNLLVVGVNSNRIAEDAVIIDEKLRLESINSINWVDYAFVLDEEANLFIKELKPDAVVKGKEYEIKENIELAAINEYGGKLLFSSGDFSLSSIDLLHKEFEEKKTNIEFPVDFMQRHNFDFNNLKNLLNNINDINVTVIGDIIVDEYINGEAIGMSQEDPTVVITPMFTEKFLGGAGIVAAHAKGLGANVDLISISGKDENKKYVEKQLKKYDIAHTIILDESRPTITKQRFRADGKTLLRVNKLKQHNINSQIERQIIQKIKKHIKNIDLLIFSDFNYGCLSQSLVEKIIKVCKENNVAMVADSQSSSQIGDISRFKDMLFITPTEREARLAMQDFNSGLVVLAENLRIKSKTQNLFMTLGDEGILVHAETTEENRWHTDKLPAFNNLAIDVAGAGDSFLTMAAIASMAGGTIWESVYLGSLAAACQVGRLGNIPLKKNELLTKLK